MTREEATEEINKVFEPAFANYIITALTEGVTASDKALEQEPCEDAINRQAAIDAIMDLCKHYTPTKSVNHPHMDFVIEVLQDLPSVTPKEKTGHWIDTCPGYYDSYVKNAHCCSNCRNYYTLDWKEMNFCPNCGVRMYEPQESEG